MKLLAVIFALTAAFAASAQTAPLKPEMTLYHPAAPLAYEVATIKPIDPKTADSMVRLPPGATLNPLSIRRYIMDAYGAFYVAQIVGGPDWLAKDSYQINAKPSEESEAAIGNMTGMAILNQRRAMQQSLLADRFHLKAHFETRVLPVYELVPAKDGLKITAVPAPPEHKGPYVPVIHISAGAIPPGTSVSGTRTDGAQELNAHAVPMEMLARYISSDSAAEIEQRPIVDHTGFTGYFDVKDFTWARLSARTTDPIAAPSLQRALEEELGIKIQPARAPIEVLVIDSIDRPSEN